MLKNRLWHRCFRVNFVNFLRTRFLQNTSGQLLLEYHCSNPNELSPSDILKTNKLKNFFGILFLLFYYLPHDNILWYIILFDDRFFGSSQKEFPYINLIFSFSRKIYYNLIFLNLQKYSFSMITNCFCEMVHR